MRITTYLKSLFVAGLSVFILSGCSSGSSASGLGLGISGFWVGTLIRNGAPYTQFTMSLIQISEGDGNDDSNAFPTSTLEGTFNANNKCITGGIISGTVNANNVSINVEMSGGGTLSMAGSASSSSSMTGSWSSAGGGEGEDDDCNLSGTWTAGR